jgi:tRNA dimethylallyltransferase
MNAERPRTIHIVAGPTASGKSSYAMDLARQLGDSVILNADSLQIYDGLSLLTAQPSDVDKAEIPHRLYASLHPNDVCSAGNWQTLAQTEIETVLGGDHTPIVCGGTGLYLKALMEGLSPIPDIPDVVRDEVTALYDRLGVPGFHEELARRDPVMAARFHPGHKARIMRAMEVLIATGKSLAEWQEAAPEGPPENWHFKVHKIMPERELLYERCNARFEAMLESGALEQVKDFAARIESGEIKPGVPLTKALGYKELAAYLNGDLSRDEAILRAQGETRRYAKRQVTWFRHQL